MFQYQENEFGSGIVTRANHGDNMRMVEFPCCDRLTPESLRQLLIAFPSNDFESNFPGVHFIPCGEHRGCRPHSDLPKQAIPLPQDRP